MLLLLAKRHLYQNKKDKMGIRILTLAAQSCNMMLNDSPAGQQGSQIWMIKSKDFFFFFFCPFCGENSR